MSDILYASVQIFNNKGQKNKPEWVLKVRYQTKENIDDVIEEYAGLLTKTKAKQALYRYEKNGKVSKEWIDDFNKVVKEIHCDLFGFYTRRHHRRSSVDVVENQFVGMDLVNGAPNRVNLFFESEHIKIDRVNSTEKTTKNAAKWIALYDPIEIVKATTEMDFQAKLRKKKIQRTNQAISPTTKLADQLLSDVVNPLLDQAEKDRNRILLLEKQVTDLQTQMRRLQDLFSELTKTC